MAKTNHFGARAAAARVLLAVGLLMLILLAVEAGPAEATFPGNNGKIAWTSGYPGLSPQYTEIYADAGCFFARLYKSPITIQGNWILHTRPTAQG